MSVSMRNAINILNAVADLGFDLKKPEDREKRSSLIQGLLMTKYDRAKLMPVVDPLRSENPLPIDRPEVACVETETK